MGRAFFAGMGAAFMAVLGAAALCGLAYIAARQAVKRTARRVAVVEDLYGLFARKPPSD